MGNISYESRGEKKKKEIEYLQEMGSFTIPKCKNISGLMDEYVTLYGKKNIGRWDIIRSVCL